MSISPHLLRKARLPILLGSMVLSGVFADWLSRQPVYAASAVTINGGTTYQTIDGFGAAEAFGKAQDVENLPARAQKQMLDLLYSPTTGAGLAILRILLPSDSGSTTAPGMAAIRISLRSH